MTYKSFRLARKIFGKFAVNREERILEKASDIRQYRQDIQDEYDEIDEMHYCDVRLKAQKKGKYAILAFDMKDSRKGYDQEKFYELIDTYLITLDRYEKERDIKVIHVIDDSFLHLYHNTLVFGDLFCVPIIYQSAPVEELFDIFSSVKKCLDIPYSFHYIDLRYDTDYVVESYDNYYVGDAFKDAETLSKLRPDLL